MTIFTIIFKQSVLISVCVCVCVCVWMDAGATCSHHQSEALLSAQGDQGCNEAAVGASRLPSYRSILLIYISLLIYTCTAYTRARTHTVVRGRLSPPVITYYSLYFTLPYWRRTLCRGARAHSSQHRPNPQNSAHRAAARCFFLYAWIIWIKLSSSKQCLSGALIEPP